MAYGKAIELFLVDGDANGLITAELSNWNGKAIKIPRTDVKTCERDDIKEAGVYFLFCQEDDGTDSVYIGEAENVRDRLIQHMNDYNNGKEPYYWNIAVIFTGRDLNKAHIRYLENKLVTIARECKHYTVLTKTTYSNTVLKESQIASMEEFIDNVRVLINTLGYNVLVPAPQVKDTTQYLYCKGNNADAKGFLSPGGLTVLKGSRTSDHISRAFDTYRRGYYQLRCQLIANKTIIDDVFQVDYEFTSPSAASSIILGRSSSGNMDWKSADGIALKDL